MGETILSALRMFYVDWLLLLFLILIDVAINLVHPFHRYVNSEILKGLMFPLKDNSVPTFAVPLIGVVLPALMLSLIALIIKQDKLDFHQSIFGLFYAIIYMAIIVDALKVSVGRPRPDFFNRCFPDGNATYLTNGDVSCTGVSSVIEEGYKSFPSGHSSWSFCGLGYLSLQLAGKLQVFNGEGHVGKLVLVAMPLIGAAAVGVTRIDDYWHHWTDVVTGAVIGLITAYICYRQLYPPLSDENSGTPILTSPMEPILPTISPEVLAVESSNFRRSIELQVPRAPSDTTSGQDKRTSQILTGSGADESLTSEQQRIQPMEHILLGKDYLKIERTYLNCETSTNSNSV